MVEEIIILPIDICRICSNLQPNLNILTDHLEDEQVLLHEALEFVGCIRIDFNDGMSRSMCQTCCKKLSDAYKFKNHILDSYRSFYNQTSDFQFKNEDRINENQSTIATINEVNSICSDSKKREEPALVIERANELGINLSTDAASFLLEHNNCKTRTKKEPLLTIQQNTRAEDENYQTDNIKTPSFKGETTEQIQIDEIEYPLELEIEIQTEENESPIENNQVDEYIEPSSIEDNQVYQMQSSSTEKENNKTLTKPNTRTAKTKLTLSDEKSFNCSDTTKNNKTCHICLKTLPKKSNLDDHLRLHANEKNFVCSFCQKAFVQIANYRMHLRVHTKERPFQCHLCPKNYSQAGSLKTHIRSHTNERNYACEVCYKDFTNNSDLYKHKIIHDLSRHFACETCGHLFTQKANLKVHERNVHCKK